MLLRETLALPLPFERECEFAGRASADWPVAGPRGAPITTGTFQAETSLPIFGETETVTTGLASERPKQQIQPSLPEADIHTEEDQPSSQK